MNFKFLLFLIILQTTSISGQTLDQALNSKNSIREKISSIERISEKYDRINIDSAIFYKILIDSLAGLSRDYSLKSQAKRNLAIVFVSRPDKAFEYAYQNLDLSKESRDCKLIARAYLILARVNYFVGNNSKVFSFWNQALTEAEKCKDKEVMLIVYSQGENFYYNSQQFEKSKELWIKMAQVDPDLLNQSRYYANIGDFFRAVNNLDSADIYYKKAIAIEENKKDTLQIIPLYLNYSLIPKAQKRYDISIEYGKKALALAIKSQADHLINFANRQLSDTYFDKGDYANAKIHQEQIVKYAEQTNRTLDVIWTNDRLATINANLKNYKVAYEQIQLAFSMYEDYNSSETKSNLNKVEEDYLKKQKQLEIDLANQQREAEKRVKNISFIALGVSFILILGIVFALIKINRSKRLIAMQQIETEEQKKIIEEKQKDILDSIRYARRIQTSLLPTDKYIDKILSSGNVQDKSTGHNSKA